MLEIVDPTRPTDNVEGHESDENGHKKVNNEEYSLLVVRNGKHPEHSIVSFNVTWDSKRCFLHGLQDFHFAKLCPVSRFLQKTSEKSRLKEEGRYSESKAGTR